MRVDRERIGHVFDNLIGNALAHTERGGSIGVSAESDGEFVKFSVADTGEGIAAEHLPRLFEKFYRVPGSRSTGGAGLGLTIAREIVTAHGGQIDVTSRPGAGATFSFRLPIDHGRQWAESSRGNEPMSHDARILIVDDEPNVRLVFRTALESSGYSITTAADGEQALERLANETVDLVLLDLQMPGHERDGRARRHPQSGP